MLHDAPPRSDSRRDHNRAPFLRNVWYVAMWSQDIRTGEMIARKIANASIVFFRSDAGVVSALADYCPHRFAPLSLGTLVGGDRIECGYHGLQIDAAGTCVFNPHGNGRIPAEARVPSFPIVERYGIIWIWIGEAAPDASAIPDFGVLDAVSPERMTDRDYLYVRANFGLVMNNLLDLSHTAYLHRGGLGSRETVEADHDLSQDGTTIYMSRRNNDVPVPPLMKLWAPIERGTISRTMRWDPPGSLKLTVMVAETGTSAGPFVDGIHLVTPETETTSHYFFALTMTDVPDVANEAERRREFSAARKGTFEREDVPMLEAQQRNIDELARDGVQPMPALLSIDFGPARLRRVLLELEQRE